MLNWRAIRKFLSHVRIKDDPNVCWEWEGTVNEHGYGQFGFEYKVVLAPRFAHALKTGERIPKDQLVLHKCDNPACCNPHHLYLGTHQDNMGDMIRKGRSLHRAGSSNPNSKLNDSKVIRIKERLASGDRHEDIALEAGISLSVVRGISNGRLWKHIKIDSLKENEREFKRNKRGRRLKQPECPAGGQIGVDTDLLPGCKDCPIWDLCDDLKHDSQAA